MVVPAVDSDDRSVFPISTFSHIGQCQSSLQPEQNILLQCLHTLAFDVVNSTMHHVHFGDSACGVSFIYNPGFSNTDNRKALMSGCRRYFMRHSDVSPSV